MKRYLAITRAYDPHLTGAQVAYKFFYGKDNNEAVLHMHRADFDGDVHNEEEVEAFVEVMACANGDGKDHITIINLASEEIIFGDN